MGKILILGANGLIGRAVTREIGKNFEWIGTSSSRKAPYLSLLDITDAQGIKHIFEEVRPSVVIHCANLKGGLDFCERNPLLAKQFHFEATKYIGKQCLEHKAKFIFISSECVFNGEKESYNEDDKPKPLSAYGKCKVESEKWIKENLRDYLIIRTMSVYGWDPETVTPNAVMKVYFSILKKKSISAPVFRWGNPTYVKDLAGAILELCLSKQNGIFHVAGATFINRYEWLRMTCEELGWDSSLLFPVKDLPEGIFLRPYKINLETNKFRMNFKTKLHNLRESLELLKQDIKEEQGGVKKS